MSRNKRDDDRAETPEERVAFCIARTNGTMPVGILARNEAEAKALRAALAASRNKAKTLITITTAKEKNR